ncbi:hypothetical protein [Streptomyces sp. SCL15-4]|uniref:hypothetical protein n=1 Tax=Streptomyces sp. SCL15-4 TaxID=2967221 RepID=UPI002966E12B|nr:hypothetical protein [Streptomyces sp. SCL15-4]
MKRWKPVLPATAPALPAAVRAAAARTGAPASAPAAPRPPIPRRTVAGPGSAEAIQRVPVGSEAARTAEVMGAYRPKTAYCSLRAPAEAGPEACAGP